MGTMEIASPDTNESTAIEVKVVRPPLQAMNAGSLFVATANELVIDCPEMLEFANDTLGDVLKQAKDLEARREAGKKPILEAGRNWDALFKPAIESCEAASKIFKAKILAYQQQQRELAAAEQRRLDAIAEAERQRLADEAAEIQRKADEAAAAERKRIADERRATELADQEARRIADEAAEAGNAAEAERIREENDRLQREADERARQAERDAEERAAKARVEAQGLQRTAAVVTAPVVAVTKLAGASTRMVWKGEGVDLMATVKAIAAGDAPLSLVMFNEPKVTQMAKSMGADMKYPGIRVWEEAVLAKRTK